MTADTNPPARSRLVSRALGTFDEIAASSMDIDILRCGPGPSRATLVSAGLGPVTLIFSSHTAPVVAQARAQAGFRTFLMRQDQGGPVRANGHLLDRNRIIDLRPGAQLHLSTSESHACVELIALAVRVEHLDRASIALRAEPFSSGPSLCSLLKPSPMTVAALRRLCTDTLASCALAAVDDGEEALAGAAWPAALADALLSTLIKAVASDWSRKDGHELTRDLEARIVGRATGSLGAGDGEATRVSQLCAAAGASERQLQRAFHSVYGFGPRRWLKLRRLQHVRSALLQAPAGSTVAAIAGSFGFSDQGRFASAYRALFGEAPSTTLVAGTHRGTHAPPTCRDLRIPRSIEPNMTPDRDCNVVVEVIDARPRPETARARRAP
jgi:AraC family ethanolamine operon transcriptional activator